MPKRTISPDSFDAILSELGDDPAIARPNQRHTSPQHDTSAMHRRQYEADAMRLPNQFPRGEPHTNDSENSAPRVLMQKIMHRSGLNQEGLWLGLALCLIASAAVNSYMIYEWRAEAALIKTEASHSGPDAKALHALLLDLQVEITENQDELLDVINAMAEQHSIAKSAPLAQRIPPPKPNPEAQALSQWRYLGMSESTSGTNAFFDTNSGFRSIGLEGLALADWRLSAADRDIAVFRSSKGLSLSIKSSKE